MGGGGSECSEGSKHVVKLLFVGTVLEIFFFNALMLDLPTLFQLFKRSSSSSSSKNKNNSTLLGKKKSFNSMVNSRRKLKHSIDFSLHLNSQNVAETVTVTALRSTSLLH